MSNHPDGGAAFPRQAGDVSRIRAGMSLRDYFAAKALQGFCANPAVFASNPISGWSLVNATEEQLAEYCAKLADAMLVERAK